MLVAEYLDMVHWEWKDEAPGLPIGVCLASPKLPLEIALVVGCLDSCQHLATTAGCSPI